MVSAPAASPGADAEQLPISADVINKVKQTFIDDAPLTDDLEPGVFFQDASYLESLPREAQSFVCAVQKAGAHPDRPGVCYLYSLNSFKEFKFTQQPEKLQTAFATAALSLWYVPADHPGRGKSNHHMGALFQKKWSLDNAPEDLNRSIHHYRVATEHGQEADETRAIWFTDLGVMLNHRFEPGDFDLIEQCYNRSIGLTGGSYNKALYLSNKGYFLNQSAKRRPREYRSWTNRAFECHTQAMELCKVHLTSDPRPSLPYRTIFNNAREGFYSQWDIVGGVAIIDACLEANRLSAEQGTAWTWGPYRSQAQFFLDKHELTGELEDLVMATESIEEAIELFDLSSTNLGDCLWIKGKIRRRWYQEDRNRNTLVEVIDILKGALENLPTTSSGRPLALNDLGNSYNQLFDHDHQPEHIDRAIVAYKEALELLQTQKDDAISDNIMMMTAALGYAMMQRFLSSRSEADLDSCISYYRRSLKDIDPSHRRFCMRAGNLTYALQLRFQMHKEVELLKESKELLTSALDGPLLLSNVVKNWLETHLGDVFLAMAELVTHSLSSIDNALEHYDLALVDDTIPQSYLQITRLNRATALKQKCVENGLPEDFETAVHAFAEVENSVSAADPLLFAIKFNHAKLYLEMYENHPGSNKELYGHKALQYLSQVASDERGTPGHRLGAAAAAASIAYGLDQDFDHARDLICISLKLLPQAILFHESRLAQLRFIRNFSYVPSSATAISLAAGDAPSTAITRLEGSRATIWDRLFGLRTPLDELRNADAGLAEDFEKLQAKLSSRNVGTSVPKTMLDPSSLLPEDEARMQRQKDAEEYTRLIDTIRKKEGMQHFLKLPDDAGQLQNYATMAPIIFVNASGYRSDALIITKSKVMSVMLPQFDIDSITQQTMIFLQSLGLLSKGDPASLHEASLLYASVMKWLWHSAAKPVLESIDFSNYATRPACKPRVLWVATGWTSILPIHAAGDYESEEEAKGANCVHDLVVSSYTSSLKALTFIRQNVTRLEMAKNAQDGYKGLMITMASTPGLKGHDLEVSGEVASFNKHLSQYMTVEELPQPGAREVKAALVSCTVAHFACHASANLQDPSQSAILLQDRLRKDGRVKEPPTFSVRTLLNLGLDKCQLVYLSACETGANKDMGLRDEGIHLANGFHMANVPHVVSTLWRVSDAASAQIADLFYENLGVFSADSAFLDFERSADALHLAIGKVKDTLDPILWGPFVYSGP